MFALWPGPLIFVAAVSVIGSRKMGLANLMHEAAHNALFADRRLTDLIGEWLCRRPILGDLPAHRRYHLQNHRHIQTDRDIDLAPSSAYPTIRASMARKVLRDLHGRTGLRLMAVRIGYHFRMPGDVDDDPADRDLTIGTFVKQPHRGVIANAVLFAVFRAAGARWWWLAVWLLALLPLLAMLTLFQVVLRVGNIAEHGAVERCEAVPQRWHDPCRRAGAPDPRAPLGQVPPRTSPRDARAGPEPAGAAPPAAGQGAWAADDDRTGLPVGPAQGGRENHPRPRRNAVSAPPAGR